MSFTPARPIVAVKNPGQITARLSFVKAGGKVAIHLPAGEAARLFGDDPIGPGYAVSIGRGPDQGKILIGRVGAAKGGLFKKAGGIRGTSQIHFAAVDYMPKAKQASAPCSIVSFGAEGVILKLPEWATPRAAMEAEFGLKKTAADRG